jgi:hypothetical protein
MIARPDMGRRGADPAIAMAIPSCKDISDCEWPEFVKSIVDLADPLQSETVKGWLLSNLRAPN